MMSHVSSLSTQETLWQPGCDVPEGSMAMGAVLQCGMNLGSLCDTPRQVLPWQFGDVSQTTCECGRFEFCRWSYDILRSGEGHKFDQRYIDMESFQHVITFLRDFLLLQPIALPVG